MTNSPHRNRRKAATETRDDPASDSLPTAQREPRALAEMEDIPPPAPVDLHGFDPAAYEWVPRPRKHRKDGWSAEKQRTFIETLADTGLVVAAARAVDMSLASCYRLRREPGGHGFAAAWEAAVQQASRRLTDIAFDRAINGVEDPVFVDGRRIGCRYRYNDRLLMFLLRAHQPDRYRQAHRSTRTPDEPPVPDVLPVPVALARLLPAQPEAPHLLLDAERLADEIEVHDQIAAIYADTPEDPAHEPFREAWRKPPEPEPEIDPLDADFERRLAWAKRGETDPEDGSWPVEEPWQDADEEEAWD